MSSYPATEKVLARCPRASEARLERAVSAALRAFPVWARTPLVERRGLLNKLADAIDGEMQSLAHLLTGEQGKPLAEAMGEVAGAAWFIRALAALDFPVRVIEDSEQRRVEAHRTPLGVVAGIVPWNFPVMTLAFKLPMALLAGNTFILKPAPTTPLTALKIGELCAKIFPRGVVNVIVDQNDLGAKLSAHPDIRKISLTGSTATGRKVMSAAAATLKRLTLELGGNDAAIVLPGSDPAKVAPGLFAGAFMNAGQVCLAIKRIYAHDSIYDSLCAELARLADAVVVDDGLAQGAQMGPVQNRMQFEKVRSLIDSARIDGKIIAGGRTLDRPGYFIRPTIVRDISDGARLVDEEQFGPVVPVIRYSDLDDAVARANASEYALGGSVWGPRNAAYQIATRIEAGTVWVNKHQDVGPQIPFAGAKQSGIGVEFAEEGLLEFTQLKIINQAR
ncbi:MAG: aldehyde dehydrogenase family protein [Thiobacillaceae bacterium]